MPAQPQACPIKTRLFRLGPEFNMSTPILGCRNFCILESFGFVFFLMKRMCHLHISSTDKEMLCWASWIARKMCDGVMPKVGFDVGARAPVALLPRLVDHQAGECEHLDVVLDGLVSLSFASQVWRVLIEKRWMLNMRNRKYMTSLLI